MTIKAKKQPAAHPGEVLEDILADNGIAQSYLNDICRGRRGISAVMAMKLAQAFNQTPNFWLNLQNGWELSRAAEAREINIPPLKQILR